MIHNRLAQVTDARELKKPNALFNGEGCNTIEEIEESLKNNEREIVCVAAEDKRLVGFCCGQIFASVCYSNDYGEITEFFIAEDFRRQGIGRRLLEYIENEFSKRGVNHLHVLTNKNNTAARSLYRSSGYADTSEVMLDKNLR